MCPRQNLRGPVVTNAIAVRPQGAMRLHGRSLMAFVLAPTAPITEWLTALDNAAAARPRFFVGRPIILDLAAVELNESQIGELIGQLAERDIRVMALEGIEADRLGPLVSAGDQAGASDRQRGYPTALLREKTARARGAARARNRARLLIESPIRSGQSIIFPNGDVTVLGSVASGAEVVAGRLDPCLRRAARGAPWPDRWAIRGRESFCSKKRGRAGLDRWLLPERPRKWTQASAADRRNVGSKNRVLAIAALDERWRKQQTCQGHRGHVRQWAASARRRPPPRSALRWRNPGRRFAVGRFRRRVCATSIW